MNKSKCCNADVHSKGGNMSLRIYYCNNCKQKVIPIKGAPPPSPRKKNKLEVIITKELITDIQHICSWYQGRNIDKCERVKKFINSL